MSAYKLKNYLFLFIMSLVSIWLFKEAGSFGALSFGMGSAYGPEFFPRILLGLMLFLIAFLAWELKSAELRPPESTPGGAFRVVGICALSILFTVAWERIGFLPTAFGFATLSCLLLRTSWRGAIAIGIFIPAAWYFFTKLLMVTL